jgi:hypothetical protein
LTDDQRKQVDELYKQANTDMQPQREEMNALERILRENKIAKSGVPGGGNLFPPQPPNLLHRDLADLPTLPDAANGAYEDGSAESIKFRIESIKQQMADENVQLWNRVSAVVRPDQMNKLLAMRHGRLLIVSQARTDLPDPTPKPKPQPAQPKPQPGRAPANNFMANHGRPIFPTPPPVKTILMNTTRSLLYRGLWSFSR